MMHRVRSALSVLSALSALSASLCAQTDPSGDWRTWKTAHFRIYARVSDSALVRLAAAEAERSFALLATELVPPNEPVELLLNDNVDFSNGFTSVSPTNRIALFLATPAVDDELGQYDEWLRVLITHELTHVFHLDRTRGIWNLGRHVFGRSSWTFPNTYQPDWVTEGLAVYYESRFSNGGRERGGFHAQLLDAASQSGAWPGPNDASFSGVRWPSGIGRYAFGGRFLGLEAATFGDSVIPRFVEGTSGQLLAGLVSNPLEHAGAEGVPEGWRRLEQRHATPRASDTILVHALRAEPRLAMAPDGRRLAYVHADGRSVNRVMVIDSAGRDLDSHIGTGNIELAWLGDTVLVTQLEFATPVRVFGDLYRWRPHGDWTRLTHGARLMTPFAWQGRPAAMRVAGDRREPAVVRGDAVVPIGALPAANEWAQIAVSPDGHWVAATRRRHARWDLVLWPAGDTAAARAITNDQAVDAEPAWSPDGAWLLFASERSGIGQVYAYHVSDGALWRVTDAPTGAREPALNRAGTLFYATQGVDGWAIARRDSALARAQPAESVTVAPPAFSAAPPVPSTESSYAEWWGLVPRYWEPENDRVGGGSGDFWGALTSASDALGRIAYSAEVLAAPKSGRWEAFLTLGLTRWRSFSFDAAADQLWGGAGSFTATDGTKSTYSERDRLGSLGVSWRTRNWRSTLSIRVGGEMANGQLVSDGPPFPTPQAPRTYAGGIVSTTVSRLQGNVLSMSAEDGFLLSGFYRARHELGGPGTRAQAIGTFNWYLGLPLPGFSHWVLAGRVAGGWTGGSNPLLMSIGGESGDVYTFFSSFTVGDGRRAFPLRGYPAGGSFSRAASGMVELRIPLLLVGRGLWRLPVGLDRVGLTLYGETGGGIDPAATSQPAFPNWATQLNDVGAEALVDVTGGPFDARVRVGAALPLTSALGFSSGTGRTYLTFGTSF